MPQGLARGHCRAGCHGFIATRSKGRPGKEDPLVAQACHDSLRAPQPPRAHDMATLDWLPPTQPRRNRGPGQKALRGIGFPANGSTASRAWVNRSAPRLRPPVSRAAHPRREPEPLHRARTPDHPARRMTLASSSSARWRRCVRSASDVGCGAATEVAATADGKWILSARHRGDHLAVTVRRI